MSDFSRINVACSQVWVYRLGFIMLEGKDFSHKVEDSTHLVAQTVSYAKKNIACKSVELDCYNQQI